MDRANRLLVILLMIFLTVSCAGNGEQEMPPKPTSAVSFQPLREAAARPGKDISPLSKSAITYLWANTGEDKVTRGELRASRDPSSVYNAAWDGQKISLFGARNEVVSFNLILEAPLLGAEQIELSFPTLSHPGGSDITSRAAASGEDVFDYRGRSIELFFIRYLEIKGVSTDLFFSGYNYDERHIPENCRRPYDPDSGEGSGTWEDRPCGNTLYPDIAVPLELHTPFSIPAGTNQSIWGDITIPVDAEAGMYSGSIQVFEKGNLTWEIPVELEVRDFTLPDLPHARTMLFFCRECIADRYLGEDNLYPEPGTETHERYLTLIRRHFQLAHRHKISLIDDYLAPEELDAFWVDALSGDLFTPEFGYDGIGVGTGNNVYSIGTYGSWPWMEEGKQAMWDSTDQWANWFERQSFDTPTDVFLYLIDESDDYKKIEKWASWINDNPGPGRELMSMATIDLPDAARFTPSLDLPASWAGFGITDEWDAALAAFQDQTGKDVYLYNGTRPVTGSFAIEDEGVALRVLVWSQFKKDISRWFYWEATYYENFQGNTGWPNVFQTAQTYGSYEEFDPSLGETGWNYLNGDGVLMYPGTDTRFPEESYGVLGPFASLRLKHWRRGIQDADYLAMAALVAPDRTALIVQRMIPSVLWEYGVEDREDPTWLRTDISWSTNPDDWEAARLELADIIENP